MSDARAGLYLHVPFCHAKCEYCDFYSLTQLDQIEAFTGALLTELELRAPKGEGVTFDTVFFGGGTPSLLSDDQLGRIWETIHRHYHIAADAEISLESNPGTLDLPKLRFMRGLGINRLSMGVQSFHPEELKRLGRIHTVAEVLENVGNARRAGFDNLNLDLMTAFPGITPDSFAASLDAAIELAPEHISCYTLIFEPGTILYKRMERGETAPLSDEEEAGYYRTAAERLGAAGYEQYEISNFARGRERRCRHNLTYWRHVPYLGLGPSAHSYWEGRRFANPRSLARYIKTLNEGRLPVDFEERLTSEQVMFEYMFLNLRLREGIDLGEFRERFGEDLRERFAPALGELTARNLIELNDDRLRLSPEGWLMADAVAACF